MGSARLKGMLIRHEGLKLKPYRDTVGKLTIGVGRNLESVGISEHEAMVLLENDIENAGLQASNTFPWFDSLDEVRQDVLISMVFNMGMEKFLGFKKMLAAMKVSDYETAAREMLDSEWAAQVKSRAITLSVMMKLGTY